LIVPLPGPLPDVIVTHEALGVGVQAHPACTVTLTVRLSPAAGIVADVGETE
jgi:hypothetical protein